MSSRLDSDTYGHRETNCHSTTSITRTCWDGGHPSLKMIIVGSAWGEISDLKWVWKATQFFTDTGGPIQWIGMKHVCGDCQHLDELGDFGYGWMHETWRDCCTNNVPHGAFCRPDNDRPKGSDPVADDYPMNNLLGPRIIGMGTAGCEVYRFVYSRDHAMLNSDMGLLLNFSVNDDGWPGGCKVTTSWGADLQHFDKKHVTHSAPAAYQECPSSSYAEPAHRETMAQWVHEFADDQETWIEEYMRAHEKMIENGYASHDLTTVNRA